MGCCKETFDNCGNKKCNCDKCGKTCNEELLGCVHKHEDECILLTDAIPILNLPAGTPYTTVIQNLVSYLANIGGVDGVDGTGVDHITHTMLHQTGNDNLQVTLWGDAGETINLGTFLIPIKNIDNASLSTSGELIINYTDATFDNLGNITGVGIQTATVDSNGDLIITLTDSSTINAGSVQGVDGNGVDHITETMLHQTGNDNLVVTLWGDSAETINLGSFNIPIRNIDNLSISSTGELIVNYTDSTFQNLGNVKGDDNVDILYGNSLGSLPSTGAYYTLGTYTLPANTLDADGEYLEFDILLISRHGDSLNPDTMHIVVDGVNVIKNRFPVTPNSELLTLIKRDDGAYSTYTLNIKLYRLTATTAQTFINWSNNRESGITSGAIEPLGITYDWTTDTIFNFNIYQHVANSLTIRYISIKHTKI